MSAFGIEITAQQPNTASVSERIDAVDSRQEADGMSRLIDYFQLSRFLTAAFRNVTQLSARHVTGDVGCRRPSVACERSYPDRELEDRRQAGLIMSRGWVP
jgi:hypothetical protein